MEKKFTNCMIGIKGCGLSYPDCRYCGFDKNEYNRRMTLPLREDKKTGTQRLFVDIADKVVRDY